MEIICILKSKQKKCFVSTSIIGCAIAKRSGRKMGSILCFCYVNQKQPKRKCSCKIITNVPRCKIILCAQKEPYLLIKHNSIQCNAKFEILDYAFFLVHSSAEKFSSNLFNTHRCSLSDVSCNDYSLNLMADIKLTISAICWIILSYTYDIHSATHSRLTKYSCEFDVKSTRSTQTAFAKLLFERMIIFFGRHFKSNCQSLRPRNLISWIFLYM